MDVIVGLASSQRLHGVCQERANCQTVNTKSSHAWSLSYRNLNIMMIDTCTSEQCCQFRKIRTKHESARQGVGRDGLELVSGFRQNVDDGHADHGAS